MNAAASTLLPSEVRRLRHATSPRELSAVLSEVEPRLGREIRLSDLEPIACGHHGRGAVQRKTATFVRQLPGWGGIGALYRLSPALETTTGQVTEYAVGLVHPPEQHVSRYGRPGQVTVSLHPATECGATFGTARFVGHEKTWHADTLDLAFACLDYDLVTPREATSTSTIPQAVA